MRPDVLFPDDLYLFLFNSPVYGLINLSIDRSIDSWILMYGIWNIHSSSVDFFPSIGDSVSLLIDRSGNESFYFFFTTFSFRLFLLSVDRLINWLVDRWILMSVIWNRHSPSIDLCLSIGVSAYPLIDRSGNVSYCLVSYWCVPPSVLSICW